MVFFIGYNPMWDEEAKFKIHVPELALVTFTVIESNNTFLGQYTLPYRCLRQGNVNSMNSN